VKWWSKLGHGKHVIESLIDKAKHLDQADPLSGIRRQFVLNDGEVYLDGNSLGALPKLVRDRLAQTIDHEWGHRQIRSWNESWIDLPQQAARKVANIVGAPADDVIFADSVSINLFKLMAAAVYTLPNRPKILSAKDMFPTDLYIAQGLKQLLGERRCDVELCDFRELQAHLSDQVSVVVLSQVNFRTGEAYDIERVTQLVHRCGARIIWGVSHSVGVLPINLQANQVDYAVGCGYKFLNGGPGAPAFAYVRPDLQDQLDQPLSGWMGHKNPFAFVNQYDPAAGVNRLLSGTPNILSLASLDAALDLYQNIELPAVFSKAQALAAFFIEAVKSSETLSDISVIEQANRGAQVSLRHPEAHAIIQALIQDGVIGDFRSPDIARFGFAPLYVSFEDVAIAVTKLVQIMQNQTYSQPEFQEVSKVT
jgi:kynureninase